MRIIVVIYVITYITESLTLSSSSASSEEGSVTCPNLCFCQTAHLMDLSIARWVNKLENTKAQSAFNSKEETESSNRNEASYDDDFSFLSNPVIKYAMCTLQTNTISKNLMVSLPNDLQALVLLYNGFGNNLTIKTSEIADIPELKILELRGSSGVDLKLEFDASLPELEYANFESIELVGNELHQRRPKSEQVHPSENFHYVPDSERLEYNVSLEINEEIEIVPYDVYLMEVQKSKMLSFYGWEHLAVLRVHDCKLDALHWEIFDGLSNLQHLSLEHNNIKIVPPFAFFGAYKIKTLSLAHNEILDLHYRSLAGLFELETLDLSYNELTKMSETTFPPFPKLKTVDLRYNPIKYIFSHTFDVMNNTAILFIGDVNVPIEPKSANPFDSLNHLTQLKILNMSAPVLDQALFKGMRYMKQIKIEGNMRLIEFDAFAEMPLLKEAILSNCKIEEISMDAFYGVKNLEYVDLSHNKLSSLPNGLFDEHILLKEIYLQNNFLTFLPKDFFLNLKVVQLVRLTENSWICNCDMQEWNQGVTNKIRKVKKRGICSDRDIKNNHCSGEHNIVEYIYDNKMSPRCNGGPENVLSRSVYNAVRKDLRCKPKVVEKSKDLKKERLTNKYYKYQEQLLHKNKFEKQVADHSAKNNNMDIFKMKKQRLMAKALNQKYAKTMKNYYHENNLRHQLLHVNQKNKKEYYVNEDDNDSLENNNNSIFY